MLILGLITPTTLIESRAFSQCCTNTFLRRNMKRCPFLQVFAKMSFTKNYLVKNLVDKLSDFDYLKTCRPSAPPKPVKMDGKCERHHEELKLYCHTDRKPICVVCRESRAHR